MVGIVVVGDIVFGVDIVSVADIVERMDIVFGVGIVVVVGIEVAEAIYIIPFCMSMGKYYRLCMSIDPLIYDNLDEKL